MHTTLNSNPNTPGVGLNKRVRAVIAFLGTTFALAGSVHAAAVADFGTNAPTPGANDISQLTADNTGNSLDTLNYYSDNGNPPGQTFTTGSNPSGYAMPTLYVKTGGYGSANTATAQSYTLRIYSVSGASATLISTYSTDNLLGFPDGDWLQYSGLTNILQPNTVYAYTHHRNNTGYDGMACISGNPYAGGQICLIPPSGGSIVFGATGNSDATFDVNLVPITDPFVFPTYINPPSAIGGNSVAISAGVGSGTQPIDYQWLFTGTNGTTTEIPNATNITYTIASVQVTNQGAYSLMVSNRPNGVPTVITNTPALLTVRAAYTIATIGTTAPTPGPNDIAQLIAGSDSDGNSAGGGPNGTLNYYADNSSPPGQTFTTGSNPSGYSLTAVYLKTAGTDSSATGTAKTYTLRLYSMSGSSATLLSTYLSDNTVGFTDGDWLRYTGMTNVLQPNTVYAYSHRQNGAGWDRLSAITNPPNAYPGGEACLIPVTGGTVLFGTNHIMDATFQISMVPVGDVAIQSVNISPVSSAGNPVYTPNPVTLTVQATGALPLTYMWQTDGGLGGAFSNIPNSNTNAFIIDTTGMSPGTYNYQVIVTNINDAATSAVVTLNLSAPSAPVLVTDTAITPNGLFANSPVSMSATFNGSLPIAYQWMFNNGSGAVAIAGATNDTYAIGSAQATNTGSYFLVASNSVSPFTNASTAMQLLVGATPQGNSSSAGMIDAGSAPPTPGTNDISQLVEEVPTSSPLAGLNYFVDNANPPGQIFTTLGASPNGYQLSSLYVQEELSSEGSNTTNSPAVVYTLGIYSVFGSNAVLITSYNSTNLPYVESTNQVSANPSDIVSGDWIRWTGLTNILMANSTYAYSVQRTVGGHWWKPANDQGFGSDLYSGGQIVLLPNSGVGAMTFSTDSTIDAAFLVALSPVGISAPHITTATVAGRNFVLSGSGGTPGSGYSVLSQTNLPQPIANWTVVGAGTFDGSGNFSFTNAITPGASKQFYLIRVP